MLKNVDFFSNWISYIWSILNKNYIYIYPHIFTKKGTIISPIKAKNKLKMAIEMTSQWKNWKMIGTSKKGHMWTITMSTVQYPRSPNEARKADLTYDECNNKGQGVAGSSPLSFHQTHTFDFHRTIPRKSRPWQVCVARSERTLLYEWNPTHYKWLG